MCMMLLGCWAVQACSAYTLLQSIKSHTDHYAAVNNYLGGLLVI